MKMNILCKYGFHNFKPRYNEKLNDLGRGVTRIKGVADALLDTMKDKEYVCDVCTRCGEIKRLG